MNLSAGAPLGLLALGALPLLLALYFLRRKQPPRRVSALFLWRSPDDRAEAGPRLHRFSREASLALELCAAIAATLFLADLRCGTPASALHTVIVLDGSLSMSALLPDGRTVAVAALETAARLAKEDGGQLTLIESGTRPRVLLGPAASPSAISSLSWSPQGASHDPAAAFNLARELAGPGSRIRFLTDKPLAAPADVIEVIALGHQADNTAFVSAHRRDEKGKAFITLRVAHFGMSAATIPLELTGADGAVLKREQLTLEPGKETGVRFELPTTGEITARLPADALPLDSQLTLLPNPRRPVNVALKLGGAEAEAVRRFLAADGASSIAEPVDLTFTTERDPVAANALKIGVRGTARTLTGPYFPDRTDPLLDEVDLTGVVWPAGESPPGRPMLTCGDVVLISEEAGGVVHLNIDLARSNLQRSQAFPILLSNLLASRRETLKGALRRHLALGEELVLALDGPGAFKLEGPGMTLPLRGHGAVRLPPPGPPGRYKLLKDGALVDELLVLAIDPLESDLRDRGSGVALSRAPIGKVSGGAGETPRSSWPLLALVLLLCADWYVTGVKRPSLFPGRAVT